VTALLVDTVCSQLNSNHRARALHRDSS